MPPRAKPAAAPAPKSGPAPTSNLVGAVSTGRVSRSARSAPSSPAAARVSRSAASALASVVESGVDAQSSGAQSIAEVPSEAAAPLAPRGFNTAKAKAATAVTQTRAAVQQRPSAPLQPELVLEEGGAQSSNDSVSAGARNAAQRKRAASGSSSKSSKAPKGAAAEGAAEVAAEVDADVGAEGNDAVASEVHPHSNPHLHHSSPLPTLSTLECSICCC